MFDEYIFFLKSQMRLFEIFVPIVRKQSKRECLVCITRLCGFAIVLKYIGKLNLTVLILLELVMELLVF